MQVLEEAAEIATVIFTTLEQDFVRPETLHSKK